MGCCMRIAPAQVFLCNRFYHGYESYMAHAFPHDDLKPLTFSYTDSLGAPPIIKMCHHGWMDSQLQQITHPGFCLTS